MCHNKVIKAKRRTILWYDDDLKTFHFGAKYPLRKTRGKLNKYLGLTFRFVNVAR